MNPFEKIKEKLLKLIDISYYKAVDGTPYAGTRNLAYHKVLEVVEQIEKEYNNGWIPCSERLPSEEECQENDNRFIVTDGNRSYQRYFDYKEQEFVEPMYQNTFNTYYDKCVTAWQPLPVPYTIKEKERMK